MIIARFSQRFKDAVLEIRIKIAFANILLAADVEETRRCVREHSSLIIRRSPAQIARMERKKGLV